MAFGAFKGSWLERTVRERIEFNDSDPGLLG
jgi:hypothetical protein